MTNATKYYIWLSLALGYSTPKCKALASIYPNISAFYQGGVMEWQLSGVLNDKDIAALEATPLEEAYEVIAPARPRWCRRSIVQRHRWMWLRYSDSPPDRCPVVHCQGFRRW